MEEKKFLEKKVVNEILGSVFMDELAGYTLSKAEVKLVFSTATMDYVPGIVIPAISGKEKKYLIYSPLQMSINIFDELPNIPEAEVGKSYHQGVMCAAIVCEQGEKEIVLYKDKVEGRPCRDKAQAEALIKAYVAMSDKAMQHDYFKISGQDIFSAEISGIKYWLKQHRGNKGFLVDTTNSVVSYCNLICDRL